MTSRFLALADVADVSHRVGVRDLATHADAIIDRLLAGETSDQVLAVLADTTLRDGYRARPLTADDIETIARFVDDVRRRVVHFEQQIAALVKRRDRITALLDAPTAVTR